MEKIGPSINGEELKTTGGDTVDVINPATVKVIAGQLCCDSKCVDEIVATSKRAFQ